MALDSIKDMLIARVNSLDAGKHDVMTEAKLVIVEELKVEVRVLGYKNSVLRVSTEDAPAASEIRLHSSLLLEKLNKRLTGKDVQKVRKLYVIIR